MERDFLGIHGRDAGDDARRSLQDAGLTGNSAVQWLFSNKAAVMPQFMFYKAVQEEKPRNNIMDKQQPSSKFHPISAMDSFEANLKAPHASAAQKRTNLGNQGFSNQAFSNQGFGNQGFSNQGFSNQGFSNQGFNQYLFHAYQPHNAGSFDASHHQLNDAITFPVLSHQNIPVTTSNRSFFKVQNAHSGPNLKIGSPKLQSFGGGNVNNHVAPRNVPKPTPPSAQLTIFYAGCVNVYDDVPVDKVQEIMSLASKGSTGTLNAVNSRSEAFLQTRAMTPTKVAGPNGPSAKQSIIPLPVQVVSPCSGHSSPISVTSHTMVNPGCGLRTNGDTTASKAVSSVVPTSQQENSKTSSAALGSETITTNTAKAAAIPQARKASLARFLERRKERLTNVMPYSSKMNLENVNGLESCSVSSVSYS